MCELGGASVSAIEGLAKPIGMLKMHAKIAVHLDLEFAPRAATLDRANSPRGG